MFAHQVSDDASLEEAAKRAVAELQGVTFPSSQGGQSAPQGDSERRDRLFVSKVPYSLTREDLRTHFGQFGEVTDVYLPAAPGGGGGHKGICFVSFVDATALHSALAQHQHFVQGQPISVDIAAPRAPPPSTVTASVASGCRVFVTKVTPEVTRADLQAYFSNFGEISDCYVPPGNKGIAFVSYRNANDASNVLVNQQHEVKPGHFVVAAQAYDRPTPTRGGRGGYGGCGGYGGDNGGCGGNCGGGYGGGCGDGSYGSSPQYPQQQSQQTPDYMTQQYSQSPAPQGQYQAPSQYALPNVQQYPPQQPMQQYAPPVQQPQQYTQPPQYNPQQTQPQYSQPAPSPQFSQDPQFSQPPQFQQQFTQPQFAPPPQQYSQPQYSPAPQQNMPQPQQVPQQPGPDYGAYGATGFAQQQAPCGYAPFQQQIPSRPGPY